MKKLKFFILPSLLIVCSIFLIVKGLINLNEPVITFTGTIENAEADKRSDYNNFKLTGGYAIPFLASYEVEAPGSKVKSVIYPYVSASYLDKLYNAYVSDNGGTFSNERFEAWFKNYNYRPRFYVKHTVEDSISSEVTFKAAMLADTLPKSIQGTRFNSSFSLGYIGTSDALDEHNVNVHNTIFIDEGMTPEDDKGVAKVLLGFGVFMGAIALVLLFLGVRKLRRLQSVAGVA